MGRFPDEDGNTDVVSRVARAIGAAQDELWPVRRRYELGLRLEDMYGRAAAGALEVVRQAIEGMEQPELQADAVGWDAYRRAVLQMLGRVE